MENTQQKLDQSVFDGAPSWVRCFAIDANGEGNFYDEPPIPLHPQWWTRGLDARWICAAMQFDMTGIDWEQTLIERAQ